MGSVGGRIYDKAIELAGNTAETAYLTRRRDQLG
jgi:RNA polymerase sigma-70 factor, ECF subfamily